MMIGWGVAAYSLREARKIGSFHSTGQHSGINLSFSGADKSTPLAFRWFCPNPLDAFFFAPTAMFLQVPHQPPGG